MTIKRDKWGIPEKSEREKLIDSFMYVAIGGLTFSIFFAFILINNPHGKIEQVAEGIFMLTAEIGYFLMQAVKPPKYENKWI